MIYGNKIVMNKFYETDKGFIVLSFEHHGIEIYFLTAPNEMTKEILISLGWRFQGYKKCWYNRDNEENRNTAIGLLGPKPISPAILKYDRVVKIDDTIVLYANTGCHEEGHHQKRLTVLVSILSIGGISEKTIPILYCEECGAFYLNNESFKEIREDGYICCRILSEEDYSPYV